MTVINTWTTNHAQNKRNTVEESYLPIPSDKNVSRKWQIKSVKPVGRPKRRQRDGIVGQQGAVWTRTAKDRESWRTLAEGYILQ